MDIFSIEKYGKHWGAEGDPVTVTCEADGNPKPELIISVDGQNAAQGAGQDATSKLSTSHTISNTGEQIVTCEIDGPNSKNAGLFQTQKAGSYGHNLGNMTYPPGSKTWTPSWTFQPII